MKKLKKRYVIVDLDKMEAAVHIANSSGIGLMSSADINTNSNIMSFYELVIKFKVNNKESLYEA